MLFNLKIIANTINILIFANFILCLINYLINTFLFIIIASRFLIYSFLLYHKIFSVLFNLSFILIRNYYVILFLVFFFLTLRFFCYIKCNKLCCSYIIQNLFFIPLYLLFAFKILIHRKILQQIFYLKNKFLSFLNVI